MDAIEKPRRGRKPSARSDGNGPTSPSADRAGVESIAPQESVVVAFLIDWAFVEPVLAQLAHKHQKHKRVVKVTAPCVDGPAFYDGMFGGAPIERVPGSEPSIQWNTGEIESLIPKQ